MCSPMETLILVCCSEPGNDLMTELKCSTQIVVVIYDRDFLDHQN